MSYRFIPNFLTLFRIALIPVLIVFIMLPGAWADVMAVLTFIVAGVSDFFDGWLARRLNVQSEFGRMLDPIADKLLVSTALLWLAANGTLHGVHLIAATIILCREILVSGLREYLTEAQVRLPVSLLAKYKTTFQMVAIGTLLGAPTVYVLPFAYHIAIILLWLAAVLTLLTGYSYVRIGFAHVNKRDAE